MNKQVEFEDIKDELEFALYAAKVLRQCSTVVKPDGLYLRLSDYSYMPDNYGDLYKGAGIQVIEENLPEVAALLELKVLELQKSAISKRLKSIREENLEGQSNGQ